MYLGVGRLPQGQNDPRNHQRDEPKTDHGVWSFSVQITSRLNVDVHVRSRTERTLVISRLELTIGELLT